MRLSFCRFRHRPATDEPLDKELSSPGRFLQHAFLSHGWMERQNHFDLLTDPLRGVEPSSFARPSLNTAQGENQLDQEEFFEYETPVVGRAALIQLRKLVIAFRKMHAFEAGSNTRKAVRCENVLRQGVINIFRKVR